MSLRKENILIVDDNYDILDLLQRQLKNLNYYTYKASSVNEAIDVLKYTIIDLLITDLNMPEINGTELLKYTDEHFPLIPKLAITGLPTIDNAISSIKAGAITFLTKPFTNIELQNAIESTLEKVKNHIPQKIYPLKEDNKYGEIIGNSAQFKNTVQLIKRVQNNKVSVLIEGETGTGKELVAKAIHDKGILAGKPFIAVNCGGIPENLIESELFGYVKGAFTGATESRIGYFQAAHGGTLFLDEVGTAPMSVQTRLLRVLQEKEIMKIGAREAEKIDIRIIAATNNNLHQMVLDGSFREDLYYRINVVNIKTAPLRDKKTDILPLTESFIKKYGLEYGKPSSKINNKVLEILIRYSWPGNVRELENVVQRMIIMSDENIEMQHVPEYLKYQISQHTSNFKSLKDYEKEQIIKVLNAVNNNKSKAAKILEIDRKTLNQKIS